MAGNQSREVIGGRRMCGKTTELIKRANKENLHILCANRDMAKNIFRQANDIGMDIPFPVTTDELPLRSPLIDKVLIDEVEMVLQGLIGKPIEAMSTSLDLKDLPSLHENEPKKSKSVGSFHVDIDCSDALKGLKAVQREAKKATQALKEVEEQQKRLY